MVRKNKKPKFISETVQTIKKLEMQDVKERERKKAPCLHERIGKKSINTLKVYVFPGNFDK